MASCSSLTRFGAGVDITFDPRTIGMQIDDTIMQKNLSARLALTEKKYLLYITTKVLDGNIFWIMNNPSPNSPWKGSMGGYGKFKIEKDSITEFMSHATGDMALYLKDMKDEDKKSKLSELRLNIIRKTRTNL